jgi:hypothetical protein
MAPSSFATGQLVDPGGLSKGTKRVRNSQPKQKATVARSKGGSNNLKQSVLPALVPKPRKASTSVTPSPKLPVAAKAAPTAAEPRVLDSRRPMEATGFRSGPSSRLQADNQHPTLASGTRVVCPIDSQSRSMEASGFVNNVTQTGTNQTSPQARASSRHLDEDQHSTLASGSTVGCPIDNRSRPMEASRFFQASPQARPLEEVWPQTFGAPRYNDNSQTQQGDAHDSFGRSTTAEPQFSNNPRSQLAPSQTHEEHRYRYNTQLSLTQGNALNGPSGSATEEPRFLSSNLSQLAPVPTEPRAFNSWPQPGTYDTNRMVARGPSSQAHGAPHRAQVPGFSAPTKSGGASDGLNRNLQKRHSSKFGSNNNNKQPYVRDSTSYTSRHGNSGKLPPAWRKEQKDQIGSQRRAFERKKVSFVFRRA